MRLHALLGTIGISFSAVLVRLVDLTPAITSFGRNAYALPLLLLLGLLWRKESLLPLIPLGWLTGSVFGVNLVLWHSSIELIGSGFATVLANTQVVFIALLGWLFLKERPRAYVLALIPVLAVGVWLISSPERFAGVGTNSSLGVIFGVVSGLSSAIYVLLFRYSSQRLKPDSSVGFLFHVSLGGAVTSAVLAGGQGFTGFIAAPFSSHGWLLALALVAQVGGWLFLSRALRTLPALETAVIMLLQPVLALAWGAIVFMESASPVQVIGIALVLLCVTLLSILSATSASAVESGLRATANDFPAPEPVTGAASSSSPNERINL